MPLKLLNNAVKDKLHYRLLALSVIIKCKYGDSRLRNVNVKAIQELMHCGFSTAKTLLNASKSSSLFKYNPHTNTLLAKDFKKKYTTKFTTPKGTESFMMYGVRVDIRDYTLRSIVKEFRKLLIESGINAKERKDEFHCNRKNKRTTWSIPNTPLTMKRMTNRIGMKSRGTTYNLIKELEAEHRVSVERMSIELACDCTSDDAMNNFVPNPAYRYLYDDCSGFLYAIKPNRYSITDKRETERFRNIIFNHKNRQTNYYKQDEVDGYWERYGH